MNENITSLQIIRNQLNYDSSQSPVENINTFFQAVKIMRYELRKNKNEEPESYQLHSAWKNEAYLKRITDNFCENFWNHLITLSMMKTEVKNNKHTSKHTTKPPTKNKTTNTTSATKSVNDNTAGYIENYIENYTANYTEDYLTILKECKKKLSSIHKHYSPSFTEVLIVTKWTIVVDAVKKNSKSKELKKFKEIEDMNEMDVIVAYEALPDEQKLVIERCYELLSYFFKTLDDIVSDEKRELETHDYIRQHSSFEWINEKNDFSELVMALFASGAISRSGTKKMMPNTLARELGAFFGIHNLNFDQDIQQINIRQKREKGKFLDVCKEKLIKILDEKFK